MKMWAKISSYSSTVTAPSDSSSSVFQPYVATSIQSSWMEVTIGAMSPAWCDVRHSADVPLHQSEDWYLCWHDSHCHSNQLCTRHRLLLPLCEYLQSATQQDVCCHPPSPCAVFWHQPNWWAGLSPLPWYSITLTLLSLLQAEFWTGLLKMLVSLMTSCQSPFLTTSW